MKRILLFCLTAVFLSSCGINKQAQQIKALEKCTYKITSADQISIAGTDLRSMISEQNINLGSLPGLALGLLRRDIPLRAKLNMEISNPTGDLASINEFEYKILINKQEIATGFVNQNVSVEPGKSTVVPIDMSANIYPFISNGAVMDDISRFLKARNGGPEQKGIVTLKIRPSIKVAGGLVKYPGFITIDKEISSKILL
ncbi:hypothetical protein [Pedobacter nutrimenti]|jgi:hypothetical protein|uniref:Late embryogenesis abundant protein n=1 Tax=Pedobacter nutrimenti TaxID=1241337 RepID=A0A318U7K0_9SPHI|nr:hypothetical protein [Pedobacter nutrimenti]PYF68842.1 hypothetical protein B0O44_11120 [Pedobacter nutrimenti]